MSMCINKNAYISYVHSCMHANIRVPHSSVTVLLLCCLGSSVSRRQKTKYISMGMVLAVSLLMTVRQFAHGKLPYSHEKRYISLWKDVFFSFLVKLTKQRRESDILITNSVILYDISLGDVSRRSYFSRRVLKLWMILQMFRALI